MNTLPQINKTQLLQRVIAAVQADLDRLKSGLELAKAAKFESATRMQSRYDTFGVESSWVADGLATNLSERQEALRQLENFKLPEKPQWVSVGCIVGLGSADGELEDLYFILPAGGGIVLPLDFHPGEINVVTPQAPIVRKMTNRRLGDELNVATDTRPQITAGQRLRQSSKRWIAMLPALGSRLVEIDSATAIFLTAWLRLLIRTRWPWRRGTQPRSSRRITLNSPLPKKPRSGLASNQQTNS